jgi:hypothetical protein
MHNIYINNILYIVSTPMCFSASLYDIWNVINVYVVHLLVWMIKLYKMHGTYIKEQNFWIKFELPLYCENTWPRTLT